MSKFIYQAAANTATGGTAIGAADQDIEVLKIIVGAPVINANIWLFTITNPGGSSNTNLATKMTLPGTLATGQLPFTINLTDEFGHGITLPSGGNIMIDQTLQATVIYREPDNSTL